MTVIWCIWFLRYGVQWTERWTISCPLPLNNLKYQHFENEKKTWRYYHFTHVHHKCQSYDAWFLRYRVWQIDFFVILGHFLPFYPLKNPKNQNFEKWKQSLELLSFYTNVPKIMIIWYTVPEIWCVTDVIVIFHFGPFFALLPP